MSPRIFRCSRKDPYFAKLPPLKGLEIPAGGGGGVSKAKKIKGKYEAKLELPEGEGGGSLKKKLFVGEELHITIYFNPRLCGINQSQALGINSDLVVYPNQVISTEFE